MATIGLWLHHSPHIQRQLRGRDEDKISANEREEPWINNEVLLYRRGIRSLVEPPGGNLESPDSSPNTNNGLLVLFLKMKHGAALF